MKLFAAIVLGLLIGAGCRYFEIPVPAPPKLVGALLVLAITLGYVAADHFLDRRAQSAEIEAPMAEEPTAEETDPP